MKTKSGRSIPAALSAFSAASRPAILGLRSWLIPTPALVFMAVSRGEWLGRAYAARINRTLTGALKIASRRADRQLPGGSTLCGGSIEPELHTHLTEERRCHSEMVFCFSRLVLADGAQSKMAAGHQRPHPEVLRNRQGLVVMGLRRRDIG